jgi:hypothetical protein
MKVNGLAGDVSKLGDRCDLIYSDNVEKQKRIKAINLHFQCFNICVYLNNRFIIGFGSKNLFNLFHPLSKNLKILITPIFYNLSEEADKLLQCERCLSWSCIKCAKVNPKEYEIFSRPDIHWFCPEKSVLQSKHVTILSSSSFCEQIDTNVKTLEMKVNGLAGDVSKLGDRCDLIYSDNVEKQNQI